MTCQRAGLVASWFHNWPDLVQSFPQHPYHWLPSSTCPVIRIPIPNRRHVENKRSGTGVGSGGSSKGAQQLLFRCSCGFQGMIITYNQLQIISLWLPSAEKMSGSSLSWTYCYLEYSGMLWLRKSDGPPEVSTRFYKLVVNVSASLWFTSWKDRTAVKSLVSYSKADTPLSNLRGGSPRGASHKSQHEDYCIYSSGSYSSVEDHSLGPEALRQSTALPFTTY